MPEISPVVKARHRKQESIKESIEKQVQKSTELKNSNEIKPTKEVLLEKRINESPEILSRIRVENGKIKVEADLPKEIVEDPRFKNRIVEVKKKKENFQKEVKLENFEDKVANISSSLGVPLAKGLNAISRRSNQLKLVPILGVIANAMVLAKSIKDEYTTIKHIHKLTSIKHRFRNSLKESPDMKDFVNEKHVKKGLFHKKDVVVKELDFKKLHERKKELEVYEFSKTITEKEKSQLSQIRELKLAHSVREILKERRFQNASTIAFESMRLGSNVAFMMPGATILAFALFSGSAGIEFAVHAARNKVLDKLAQREKKNTPKDQKPLFLKQRAHAFQPERQRKTAELMMNLIKELPVHNPLDEKIVRRYERAETLIRALGMSPHKIVDVREKLLLQDKLTKEISDQREGRVPISDDFMEKNSKLLQTVNDINEFKLELITNIKRKK